MSKPFTVRTKNKNTKACLAKVPKYIGETLMKIETDTVIGYIDYGENNKNPSIVFNEILLKYDSIPMQHKIIFKDKKGDMALINDDYAVLGTVNKECNILPVINKDYLKYKSSIYEKVENEIRHTKVIKYSRIDFKSEKFEGIKRQEAANAERKRLLQDSKRERAELNDLFDKIFKAFEIKHAWTVNDLAKYTNQPVNHVQGEIVKVAELSKNNNKNMYVLKKEYTK